MVLVVKKSQLHYTNYLYESGIRCDIVTVMQDEWHITHSWHIYVEQYSLLLYPIACTCKYVVS